MKRNGWRIAMLAFVVGAPLTLWAADDKTETKKPEAKKERLTPFGTVTLQIGKVTDTTITLLTPKRPMPGAYRPPLEKGEKGERKNPNFDETEVTLAEEVKIRLPPVPELDDKGRPKPIKKDPKDPDRNLPGVRGLATDLKERQWVTVTLAQNRDKPPKTFATLIIVHEEMNKDANKKK